MSDENFDVFTSLLRFQDTTKTRLREYKIKYPILHDYCDIMESELTKLYDEYRMSGPNGREKKAASLSAACYSILTSLEQMDHEGFSFLYDENLWSMLRSAMTQNGLPINQRWIKTLVASNILELTINDTLKKLDRIKYDSLNKQNAGLGIRFKELNSLLESSGLQKFKLNSVEFESLKAIRNIADHPDPSMLNEIQEKHVKETIAYAHYAMNQLKEAHEELQKQKK